eukprot:gene13635-biopygen2013
MLGYVPLPEWVGGGCKGRKDRKGSKGCKAGPRPGYTGRTGRTGHTGCMIRVTAPKTTVFRPALQGLRGLQGPQGAFQLWRKGMPQVA